LTQQKEQTPQMSYRRFDDTEGRAWEAWEVHPSTVERRLNQDRRAERRRTKDRRTAPEIRLVIPRELAEGWLALQGRNERLRISPIPDGWMNLSDEELRRLVIRATMRGQKIS
jgi:hypothetical protein